MASLTAHSEEEKKIKRGSVYVKDNVKVRACVRAYVTGALGCEKRICKKCNKEMSLFPGGR